MKSSLLFRNMPECKEVKNDIKRTDNETPNL